MSVKIKESLKGLRVQMEKSTHFFYAVKIPSETKRQLQSKILPLKEELPFHRWVHPEDYHITLAFLGNAERGMLEKSIQLNSEALSTETSFPLCFEGIGTFGSQESPRIFWLRLEEQERLHEVRKTVFRACEEAGFSLEKRPFHPHVTVARKWKGNHPFNNQKLQKENPFDQERIPFGANEIVLYQTHLDREPKYEVVHSFII
jgi:RNA 2',3'-cyclic 3'-phosphodiesterase